LEAEQRPLAALFPQGSILLHQRLFQAAVPPFFDLLHRATSEAGESHLAPKVQYPCPVPTAFPPLHIRHWRSRYGAQWLSEVQPPFHCDRLHQKRPQWPYDQKAQRPTPPLHWAWFPKILEEARG